MGNILPAPFSWLQSTHKPKFSTKPQHKKYSVITLWWRPYLWCHFCCFHPHNPYLLCYFHCIHLHMHHNLQILLHAEIKECKLNVNSTGNLFDAKYRKSPGITSNIRNSWILLQTKTPDGISSTCYKPLLDDSLKAFGKVINIYLFISLFLVLPSNLKNHSKNRKEK